MHHVSSLCVNVTNEFIECIIANATNVIHVLVRWEWKIVDLLLKQTDEHLGSPNSKFQTCWMLGDGDAVWPTYPFSHSWLGSMKNFRSLIFYLILLCLNLLLKAAVHIALHKPTYYCLSVKSDRSGTQLSLAKKWLTRQNLWFMNQTSEECGRLSVLALHNVEQAVPIHLLSKSTDITWHSRYLPCSRVSSSVDRDNPAEFVPPTECQRRHCHTLHQLLTS